MKKIMIFFAAFSAVIIVSCERDDLAPVLDARVGLDGANSYRVGEPVRFVVEGNADYVLFWSGEAGHDYLHRNRTELAMDQIEAVTLKLGVMARYGTQYGSLQIGVSDGFEGLTGAEDPENGASGGRDKAVLTAFGGIGDGWQSVGYELLDVAANSDKMVEMEVDIRQYVNNFAVALHWLSPRSDATQRSYYATPSVEIRYRNGFETVTFSAAQLGFRALSLVEARAADVYDLKQNGKGNVSFTNSTSPLFLQGASANELSYAIDTWCISTPMKLNRVDPDRGVAIKGLADNLRTFEHTYTQAGTYTVAFVMNSGNYTEQRPERVQELTFTIIEPIE